MLSLDICMCSDYSLPGGYRKIVVQPERVAWEMLHYNDYQVSLIRGDMEMLKKEELLPRISGWPQIYKCLTVISRVT